MLPTLLTCFLLSRLLPITSHTTRSQTQNQTQSQLRTIHTISASPPPAAAAAAATEPTELLVNDLRNRLTLAGEMLSRTQRLSTPVQCACRDYCSGRCFAPACHACHPSAFNGAEYLCLASGPFGTGLLCQSGRGGDGEDLGGGERACCIAVDDDGAGEGEAGGSGGTTACAIVGEGGCDCGRYKPLPALFPPPPDRVYVEGKCVMSGASVTTRRVESGGSGRSTGSTVPKPAASTAFSTRFDYCIVLTAAVMLILMAMVIQP